MLLSLLFSGALLILALILGSRLWRFIYGQPPEREKLLWALATGLACMGWGVLILGRIGIFNRTSISLLLLGFALLSLKEFTILPKLIKSFPRPSTPFLIAWTTQALLNLLNSLTPPTEGDALHTYLTAPKWWAIEGTIGHVSSSTFNGFFGIPSLLNALALLFNQEAASLLLSGFSFGILCSFAVYSLTRQFEGSPKAAAAAATVFLCLPDVWYAAASAKVDLGTTFFSLIALMAFLDKTMKREERIAWIAFFMGISLWCKLGSLMIFLSMGAALLAFPNGTKISKEKINWLDRIKITFLYSVLSILFWSPSLFLNWHLYGNPLFPMSIGPFKSAIKGSIQFTTDRAAGTHITDHYYYGITGFFRAIFHNTYLDRWHGFGPFFLMFLPVFVWGLIKTKTLRAATVLTIAYLVLWNYVRQLSRDLLVILGFQCALVCTILWNEKRKVLQTLVFLSAMVLVLQNVATVVFFERVPYIVQGMSREEYLKKILPKLVSQIPRWDVIEWVNTNIAPEVVSLNFFVNDTYYFDRQTITNCPPKDELMEMTEDQLILEKMREHKIAYIWNNRENYIEPGAIPPRVLQKDFLDRYSQNVYRDDYADIYKLNEHDLCNTH